MGGPCRPALDLGDRQVNRPELSYHLLFPSSYEPGLVMLSPDQATADRPYLARELLPGPPLRFTNGFGDRLPGPGHECIDEMLVAALTFGVRDRVRELIEGFAIEGLQFYPMVFVDARGREHPDYWYMNLHGERDFLDLNASQVLEPPSRPGDRVYVTRYVLDAPKMETVAEESRLIFRLQGVLNMNFFVHDRILALLEQHGVTGYRAFRVGTFDEGMQY
jgi:hypothetical protein